MISLYAEHCGVNEIKNSALAERNASTMIRFEITFLYSDSNQSMNLLLVLCHKIMTHRDGARVRATNVTRERLIYINFTL